MCVGGSLYRLDFPNRKVGYLSSLVLDFEAVVVEAEVLHGLFVSLCSFFSPLLSLEMEFLFKLLKPALEKQNATPILGTVFKL